MGRHVAAGAGRGRDASLADPDADHPDHRGFAHGPAQDVLRASILQDRKRFPRLLRTLLWAALGLSGLAALLIVGLAILDPRTLGIILQLMGLSFAVGREAAILHAYGQDPTG